MRGTQRPITFVAALSAAAASFAAAPLASATTWNVNVFSFDFSINPIGQPIVDPTIQLGDTVRWTLIQSPGGVFHDVTSVINIPEAFQSRRMTDVGQTFEHTFTNLGSWWYYCSPHGFDRGDGTAGGMAGVIHVVPAPAAFALPAIAAFGASLRRRRR